MAGMIEHDEKSFWYDYLVMSLVMVVLLSLASVVLLIILSAAETIGLTLRSVVCR